LKTMQFIENKTTFHCPHLSQMLMLVQAAKDRVKGRFQFIQSASHCLLDIITTARNGHGLQALQPSLDGTLFIGWPSFMAVAIS
jgi:hypothetical protein